MKLQSWISGFLLLSSTTLPGGAAMSFYDPKLCYVLDGFLGLFGLVMTGLFIKEKFFKTKVKGGEDNIYSDLDPRNRDPGPYAPLRDAERGRNRRMPEDSVYTDLQKRKESSYKELPAKKERHRKNDVYQDLSSATRDTYDSLHMQPLPAR